MTENEVGQIVEFWLRNINPKDPSRTLVRRNIRYILDNTDQTRDSLMLAASRYWRDSRDTNYKMHLQTFFAMGPDAPYLSFLSEDWVDPVSVEDKPHREYERNEVNPKIGMKPSIKSQKFLEEKGAKSFKDYWSKKKRESNEQGNPSNS